MNVTLGNYASSLYSQYTYTSSNSDSLIDASEVSEDSYGISDVSSALDTLSSAVDVNISSLTNVTSYVSELYNFSQSDAYDEVDSDDDSISNLLTNTSDFSSITGISDDESTAATIFSLSSTLSSTSSAYQSTIDSSIGSLLDISI